MPTQMTPEHFEQWLTDAITEKDENDTDEREDGNFLVSEVRTYAESGMMTNDSGIVVHFSDGQEYRITFHDATWR